MGGRYRSGLLRALERALREDFERELDLTLRVAVLLALELSRPAIAKVLGVTAGDVRAAIRRLREVAPGLDRDAGLVALRKVRR